ncbi:MAG: chromate transporter [Limnochordia bacterium]|nr:chromate transporter [Bacillota bacterium]
MPNKNHQATYLQMFISFFKIGAFTFGGGFAMLPLIEREVIERHKWVDRDEILDIYALAQSVPGVIAVNSSMLIGYRLRGVLGAIVASIGVTLPSLIVIIVIAKYFQQLIANVWIARAMAGISGAVAALIINAALRIAGRTIKGLDTFLIALLSFLLVTFTQINVFYIMLLAGLLGYLLKSKGAALRKGQEQ